MGGLVENPNLPSVKTAIATPMKGPKESTASDRWNRVLLVTCWETREKMEHRIEQHLDGPLVSPTPVCRDHQISLAHVSALIICDKFLFDFVFIFAFPGPLTESSPGTPVYQCSLFSPDPSLLSYSMPSC